MHVVRYLPRTGLTGLAKLNVNSIRVMHKQSDQLTNMKIHIVFNIPHFTSRLISFQKSGFFPQGKTFFNKIALHNGMLLH
jgi:hypothetical protein